MNVSHFLTKKQKNTPNFGENGGVWEYKTEGNETLCYVVRHNDVDGKKVIKPWTYQNNKWVNKWISEMKRPLFNLQLLKLHPEKPILLVEGEKTAEAGMSLFTDFNVMTWLGGCSIINKVDFTPLFNRVVYLLPDNDKAGYEAAEKIKKVLLPNVSKLYFVTVAALGLPDKWDIADIDGGEIDFIDIYNQVVGAPQIRFDPDELTAYDFPDVSKKGNVLNTTDNIDYLLNHFKVKVKHNLMTNCVEFYLPGKKFTTPNESEHYLTEISNLCVKNSVPKADIRSHIDLIAARNQYHPARDFIESKPWDGISRINEFFDTIQCDNKFLADKLMYRWMLGSIAAAYTEIGVSLEGVLIFQGKQNIGKTYWFLKLVPEKWRCLVKAGLMLDPNNKDSVINCTSTWLGELSEIDGIIRKSDVSAQKSFLTQQIDRYRVPYGRNTIYAPRRTSFYGSVNPDQYLIDSTGNRRYWSVGVTAINYDHVIDMQQVWAEFKNLFDKGESYRLTMEEKLLLNEENTNFEVMDPIEEDILKRFNWDSPYRNLKVNPKQLLEELNYDVKGRDGPKMVKKCAELLGKITGKKSIKTNGIRVFFLPNQKP